MVTLTNIDLPIILTDAQIKQIFSDNGVNLSSSFLRISRHANGQILQIETDAIITAQQEIDISISALKQRVEGAKGEDIASANSLTLGDDGNSFTITGTNDLNFMSIIDWTVGSTVILEFPSGLTITHGESNPAANFVPFYLNKEKNFMSMANATLTLWYNGTHWKEVSRMET